MEGLAATWVRGGNLDLTLNDDRRVQGKLCHSRHGPRANCGLVSKERNHEIGKAVDDLCLASEPGRRVNHPEHPYPAEHAIKIAQFALEVTQNAQGGISRRRVALFDCEVGAHLPRFAGKSSVLSTWPVPGDYNPRADDANLLPFDAKPWRDLHFGRKSKTHLGQLRFDSHHSLRASVGFVLANARANRRAPLLRASVLSAGLEVAHGALHTRREAGGSYAGTASCGSALRP